MNDSFIKLHNFLSQAEADMAKNALDAEGIKSFTQLARSGSFLGGFGVGIPDVDLFVAQKDLEKAREILKIFGLDKLK